MSRSMKPRCSSRRVQRLFALLASLVAAPAFGRIVDVPAVMDSDLDAPPTVATLQYGHQLGADVEDGGGTEVSRDTAFFRLGHRIGLGEKSTLFLLGSYTLHACDFDGGRAADNSYQWDRVHRGVLAGIVGHDVNDLRRLLGGASIRY